MKCSKNQLHESNTSSNTTSKQTYKLKYNKVKYKSITISFVAYRFARKSLFYLFHSIQNNTIYHIISNRRWRALTGETLQKTEVYKDSDKIELVPWQTKKVRSFLFDTTFTYLLHRPDLKSFSNICLNKRFSDVCQKIYCVQQFLQLLW